MATQPLPSAATLPPAHPRPAFGRRFIRPLSCIPCVSWFSSRSRRRTLLLLAVLLLALLALLPPIRAALVRNLAWLSLQRAVLGSPPGSPDDLRLAGGRFARAAAISPADALALDGLGLVYLHYGADDTAADLFARVPAGSPWIDVARLHLLIAQIGELNPQGAAVVGSVARSWCEPAGIQAQIQAFASRRSCGLAYEWRAWIESRCQLPELVRGQMMTVLGNCYVESGDWPAGIALLEEAVQLSPSDPAAWLALGDAWLLDGDTARALAAFRSARDLAPTSEAVRSRLQQLGAY